MKKFLIIYGLAATEGDTDATILSRNLAFARSVHRYGLAWSGRGGTIILKTDVTLEQLAKELLDSIDRVADFVSILFIPDNPEVMYGGWLVDDESFLELLPGAIDVTYDDPSSPVSSPLGDDKGKAGIAVHRTVPPSEK